VRSQAKAGEPLDTVKDEPEGVPPAWKAAQHERLLGEIEAELERAASR